MSRSAITKQLRTGINLLLVAVALLLLWQMVSLLLAGPPITDTRIAPAANNALPAGRWAWFNSAREPVVQDNLQKARINARLLGVVVAGERSIASIAAPGKPDGVYRIGDKIDKSATLEAVEPHRVVVSENGANRELLLEPLGDGNGGDDNPLLRELSEPTQTRQVVANTPFYAVAEINGQRALVLDNVSDDIQRQSGLRNGDAVLSINGENAIAIVSGNNWQNLINQSSVPVTVLRDGAEQQIYVDAAAVLPALLAQFQSR